MDKDRLRKLGLAAIVLFAPGGFILGAGLAADHLRKRSAARRKTTAPETGLDPE